MKTSDGTYRSPEALQRRKENRARKQAEGRYNHTKKAYVERNPEKRKAHNTLNNAVRDGKIVKPAECSKCGEGGRIMGHHHDYSKPLEVVWCCSKCHRAEHT